MTFDVHQLDPFLLVGSAGHARGDPRGAALGSRVGLPSLLFYLLMGVLLGEAGLGIAFEDAQLAHALGFAALVAHPGRGRPDHQLARDPARR